MILVEVEGEEQMNAAVQRLVQAASPISLVGFMLGTVEPHLRDRIVIRFAREGDSASGKWAQLKDVTGLIRRSKGYRAFHPINERTGGLRRGVLSSAEIRSTGAGASLLKPASGGGREFQKKLAAAQRGGVSQAGNAFPARPVLALDKDDADWIITRLWQFFEEAVNAGGV